MNIDSCSFGSITVDGKTYSKDLILFPDRINENWRRKKGHNLSVEDLKAVFDYRPDILVIGTGAFGVMKVRPRVVAVLEEKGFEVHIEKSGAACDLFNRLIQEGRNTVLAIHLTC